MIWIIIAGAVVVLVAVLFTTNRLKVLAAKAELERTIQGVLDSFGSLRAKITESDMRENEKKLLLANLQRNVDQLEQWKNSSIPNITFWKNHTAPIEKEFASLKETVDRELSKYDDLPNLTV